MSAGTRWSGKVVQPPDWLIGLVILGRHVGSAIRLGATFLVRAIFVVAGPAGYVLIIQRFQVSLEDKLIVVGLYVFGLGVVHKPAQAWTKALISAAGRMLKSLPRRLRTP